VLASQVAFGPSRARYTPVAEVRQTSEKELILCNLLARRDALLALGGFNEALYPNEENALMDELQKRGGKLIYDPQFFVYRRPRATLKAFAKMLMTYGRGRAEQFRLHPTFGSVLNFVPPLFLFYLLLLIIVAFVASPSITKLLVVPLAIYVLLVLGEGFNVGVFYQGARSPRDKAGEARPVFAKRLLIGAATAPLIVLTHVLYGFGFWRGMFTSLAPSANKPSSPITIERVGT
jgi:hypothetical protein